MKRKDKQVSETKKKIKLPMKGKTVVLISFFLPVIILAFVYILLQMYPFGDKTPLTIDLYHQYAPFLEQLRDKMTASWNFFYSWNVGLGANFLAEFAYYLASPLNLILLIFPAAYITEAVTVLTLIKVGAAGALFANFLRRTYCYWGSNTISTGHPDYIQKFKDTATNYGIIIISAFYALSGYMLVYSWNIMWLDVVALFPLMMLGVHRLVRDGKFILYTLTLTLILLCNYYVALFVCLFTVVYFPVVYVSNAPYLKGFQAHKYRHFFKRLLQIAGYSLLGVGMSAILTLPTYLSLRLTSATLDKFPDAMQVRFSLFEFLSRHLIDMPPAIRETMPNIYVGVLTFAIIPLYVYTKQIRLGEKIAHLALLFFMFLSFNLNILDFIWHGMHYPNQLPYRYSFVYCFLLLVMAFRVATSIRFYSPRVLAVAFGSGILYAILAEPILAGKVDHESAYITIILLLIYAVLLLQYANRKERLRFVASVVSVICVAELFINTFMTLYTLDKTEYYSSKKEFVTRFDDIRTGVKRLEKEDPSFWRMESIQQKTTNSPALYDYRGFTIFSSTSLEKTAKLMKKFGFHGNDINSYKYTGSTAVMDALLGIKYKLNQEKPMIDPYLIQVKKDAAGYWYKNEKVLPVGFMVDRKIEAFNAVVKNPFVVQENFVKAMGVLPSDLFFPMQGSMSEVKNLNQPVNKAHMGLHFDRSTNTEDMSITLKYPILQDQHVYGYYEPDKASSITVSSISANGIGTEKLSREIHQAETVDFGYFKAGETAKVVISGKADGATKFDIHVVGLKETNFQHMVQSLSEQPFVVTTFTDNRLEGTVSAIKSGDLFLSIPYDPSWRASVDGKAVTLQAVGGGLSMLPVEAGEHKISLHFVVPLWKEGVIISLGSVLIFVVLAVLYHLMNRQKRLKYGRRYTDFDMNRLNSELDEEFYQTNKETAYKIRKELEEEYHRNRLSKQTHINDQTGSDNVVGDQLNEVKPEETPNMEGDMDTEAATELSVEDSAELAEKEAKQINRPDVETDGLTDQASMEVEQAEYEQQRDSGVVDHTDKADEEHI